MNIDDLTPELQAQAKECKTPEELFTLAKKEGVELSLNELEEVSGGEDWQKLGKCSDNCYPYNCGTFC